MHRMVWFLCALAMASIALPIHFAAAAVSPLVTISLILGLGMGVRAVAFSRPQTRYFVTVFVLLFLGIGVLFLRRFAIIPSGELFEHCVNLGIAANAVLAAIAWGMHLQENRLAREKRCTKNRENEAWANQQPTRLDRIQDAFLMGALSDFSPPMNSMIGLVEGIINGSRGNIADSARDDLQVLLMTIQRLNRMIKDTLDYAKLKHSEIRLEHKPVDLKQIVELTLMLLKPMQSSQGIEAVNQIPDGTWILGDKNRLMQIFHNIVSNAIKYTTAGTVTVEAVSEDDKIRIVVADTGIGIPADRLERLFEPIENLDYQHKGVFEGSGLSLPITRHLVELHHGEIWAESQVGKGSRFYFTLRKLEAGKGEKREKNEEEIRNSQALLHPDDKVEKLLEEVWLPVCETGHKILVFDEDQGNLRILHNLLTEEGYCVKSSKTTDEALKYVEETPFHLIIIDVLEPDQTGYPLCEMFRKRFSYFELPILILISKAQVQKIVGGPKVGASDYLEKPFYCKELLSRVRNLVAMGKAVKQTLESAKRLESERERREMAETLRELAAQLATSLELREVGALFLLASKQLLHFDRALLLLKKSDQFEVFHGAKDGDETEFNKKRVEAMCLARGAEIERTILDSYPPVDFNEIPDLLLQMWDPDSEMRSRVYYPIVLKHHLNKVFVGALIFGRTAPQAFKEHHHELGGLLTLQFEIAVNNALLYDEVKYLASIDSLTGVNNRRRFFEMAENEVNDSIHESRILSIGILDIDHFKRINDTAGHLVGDQVLKMVAQRCVNSLRSSDIIGRFGGEEFVVLLPGADLGRTYEIFHRIRRAIADEPIQVNGHSFTVTVSAGVTSLNAGESLEKLVEKADTALLRAKKHGRNRVEAA